MTISRKFNANDRRTKRIIESLFQIMVCNVYIRYKKQSEEKERGKKTQSVSHFSIREGML